MNLVTGGTGFVGSHLIRALLQGGEKVRAIRRPSSSLKLLQDCAGEVEWVSGDVLDIFSLEDAMEGVDRIYHSAAVVSYDPKMREQMMKVNVEGTANVVNAAIEKNIKRLLHVSSVAAIGRDKKANHISEKSQWQQSRQNTNYAISKFRAEREVWRGIAEGLDAVIVNPSVILGCCDWESGTGKIFSSVWKGFPFYTNGITGFVDVRDVAEAMIKLVESGISRERFIVSSENLAYRQVFNAIAECFNKKPPHIKVSPLMSRAGWRFLALATAFSGKEPLITKESAGLAHNRSFYDNSKIREAINIRFRPVKETIRKTCEKFLEEKYDNKPVESLAG